MEAKATSESVKNKLQAARTQLDKVQQAEKLVAEKTKAALEQVAAKRLASTKRTKSDGGSSTGGEVKKHGGTGRPVL